MNSVVTGPGDLEGRQATARMLTERAIWWKILSFAVMVQVLSKKFASETNTMHSLYDRVSGHSN